MSSYWSNLTMTIIPYVPGEQPKDKKYIKLNTNENPYPPSPKVIEAITNAVNNDLRLYPDPSCEQLRATLAQHFGLKKEQVFVGNGSDEILAFSFPAFFNQGDYVYFPDITYSFFPVYAHVYKLQPKLIPLNEAFEIPMEKFIDTDIGVIFPNPNALTGKFVPVAQIEYLLSKFRKRIVIIDEAYIDFGGESAVRMIDDYPNLLVIQTLSKSRSLAGLRLGYALGHQDLIGGLVRVKDSFNSYTLDRLALAGGIAAIEDDAYFQHIQSKIIETRIRTTDALRGMGFTVIDSMANFIFMTHHRLAAEELFIQLREQGILVRYFKKPRIDNYLRVTIGTDEEMDVFMEVIGKLA